MRLESFYGIPLCTPARASLMTGLYPMRTGLQTFVIFPGHTYGLPTEETTLPQALKNTGLKIVALITSLETGKNGHVARHNRVIRSIERSR